jgi:hypothetical protein
MKRQRIFFICAAAFVINASPSPQDTFKIVGALSGVKFAVVNIRTNETRQVAAVRETNGQYYFASMSRMPEFNNKLLTGYFSYDSLVFTGKRDSVFITVAIVGNITAVAQGRAKFKPSVATENPSAERTVQYTLRGCRVKRLTGMLVRKENGRIRKSVNVFINSHQEQR